MPPAALMDFAEMRQAARRRLPRAIFDYIDRGTEAETAIPALRHGFDSRRIVQRGEPAEFGKNRTLRFSGHP